MIAEGLDYCRLEKMIHKGFLLSRFKKLMKEWMVGSYLVMKITPRLPGDIPLVFIGYKYNSRKIIGSIDTEGLEVMNQVIPIYILSLKIITIFLFNFLLYLM